MSVEYDSAIKRNGLLMHLTTQMNLKIIVLDESLDKKGAHSL